MDQKLDRARQQRYGYHHKRSRGPDRPALELLSRKITALRIPRYALPVAVSLQSRLAGATVTASPLAQDGPAMDVHPSDTFPCTPIRTGTALILHSGVKNILRCDG